jgi:histidinol phosphatase-like PHP family hydrolase
MREGHKKQDAPTNRKFVLYFPSTTKGKIFASKVSLLKIARKEGARISLGTDAHYPWQLLFMDFSLAAACLARISPDRIINFMPVSH